MCRLRLWRLCDLRALEREEGAQFPAAVDLIESFQNERGLTIHILSLYDIQHKPNMIPSILLYMIYNLIYTVVSP